MRPRRQDLRIYLDTLRSTWRSSRMCTWSVCVYVCNNNGEAVTRRIPVEPRLGSKTLPQITEPLSYPFVYWSSILGRCNGTWETLARCPLDWTKEGEGESEIAGQGSRADFGRTIPFSYPRSGR